MILILANLSCRWWDVEGEKMRGRVEVPLSRLEREERDECVGVATCNESRAMARITDREAILRR